MDGDYLNRLSQLLSGVTEEMLERLPELMYKTGIS
jgi:hypothetical protein